jgi:hypothetical protein
MAQAQLRSLVRHLHRLTGEAEADPSDRRLLERFARNHDESAFAALVRLGEGAADELRKALDVRPAVETRRRLEELLERQTSLSPTWLQTLRAVEVLEKIGSHEAQQVLKKLAKGVAGAHLTREAGAALARLAGRS